MINILLGNRLVKGVISKLISRSIRKATGYNAIVTLNTIDVNESGEDYVFKIDTKIVMKQTDIERVIDSILKEGS